MLNVILPMAGYGRRFREAGYEQEKPLIVVGGRTLLNWSTSCLPLGQASGVLPVLRFEQLRMFQQCEALGTIQPVVLFGPTQGAALSVLAAVVGLPPDEPVLVANCDQWVKIDWERAFTQAAEEMWDGFVLTFPGTGPAWSYAVTNGTDRIVWVVEKKPVSPHATVGVYWWRRASDLVRSVCAMVASGQRTNNEFYLAPSMNFLPLADKDVRIVPVDEFHGLGTPEQVKEFEALVAGGWRP